MADIGYSYGVSDEELYQTNLYGGTDADLDNTTPVDDTDGYTSNIDITDNMFATIDFKFTGSNSTDDLVLTLYKRRDSSWDNDEMAIWSVLIPNDGSEDIYPFDLGPHKGFGPGHYRWALQSEGTTTTFDVDVEMRRAKYIST